MRRSLWINSLVLAVLFLAITLAPQVQAAEKSKTSEAAKMSATTKHHKKHHKLGFKKHKGNATETADSPKPKA